MKNIGFHTRLCSDNTRKIVGGSFGGSLDMETVERLSRLFSVTVKPSGRAVFVDSQGREVTLYLSVDPDFTSIGKAAIKSHREKREAAEREAAEREEREAAEISRLMENLTHAEIVEKLKN
jgi:hypothetical protein